MNAVMKEARPKVSIVVLNWNGKFVTSECLDSLKKVKYDNFEVIIVDNGSEDGSQEHFKKNYSWAKLIENRENLGFTGGNNVGMKYALKNGTDYVLLLNNDTVVDPLFLEDLIRVGESDNEIGLLNPKIYYYDHPKVIWYAGGKFSLLGAFPVHIGRKEIDVGQYDALREVSFINGCAFLIKRKVIDEIGFLDENFFIYAEDTDWSIRARKAGYKAMYVPTSIIWHKEGVDSRRNKGEGFRLYLTSKNTLYVVYKNFSRYHFFLFLFYFSFRWLLYMSLKMLLLRDYKAFLALYKGCLDFLPMVKKVTKNNIEDSR